MPREIKIIDLFAGPGGLGEGFSAYRSSSGDAAFKIKLSIENEASAHQTLRLRAFYRQFARGEAPQEYYDFLDGKLGNHPDEELFRNPRFKKQVIAASDEARLLTLGAQNRKIYSSIENSLTKRPGNWVLIGGPPCQAYSLAGRSRNKGIKGYRIEKDHRSSLYKEYLKVINRYSPAVFVMENVKGLLSAKHNGSSIFDKIKHDFANPSYALNGAKKSNDKSSYEIFSLVEGSSQAHRHQISENPGDFLIRSENYGVPQTRHRVILLGVRKDVLKKRSPGVLTTSSSPPLNRIIGDLPALRSGLSKQTDSSENWTKAIQSRAAKVIKEVRSAGMKDVANRMQKAVASIEFSAMERGHNFGVGKRRSPKALKDWYEDPSGWKSVCNHDTRGHMASDLMRYLFCAAFGQTMRGETRRTPKAQQFPEILAPAHENWKTGDFSDRFRVQAADLIATTVTSHISKDGHYFIHYDPEQCRSLTVREAARIQTFPDNYFFVGGRTDQYVQVGNAVPPYLANQIAAIVADILSAN